MFSLHAVIQGKVPADDTLISVLQLKAKTKLMMVGTREETIAAANEKPKDMDEVIDDFDVEEDDIQTENRYETLGTLFHIQSNTC